MRGKHVFIQVNRRRFFQDETSSIPPEIERLENSVEAVLFSGKDKTKQLSEFRNASYAVANQANLDTDRHFLIEAILGHLNEFMAELGVPNPVQLEVVKLHVESIIAVSGGQEFKAGNLKENPLLQGLRMAAEKARET